MISRTCCTLFQYKLKLFRFPFDRASSSLPERQQNKNRARVRNFTSKSDEWRRMGLDWCTHYWPL
jgi:hypothetical protein